MLQERISAGVRAGLIATAATSGVLVAYGLRGRAVTAPFQFLGVHLGGFTDARYPQSTVVLAGFLLHAAWVVAWCLAYSVATSFFAPKLRIPLAIVTTAIAWYTSTKLLGSALDASSVGGARWLFMYIVFGFAMYSGTRFAH